MTNGEKFREVFGIQKDLKFDCDICTLFNCDHRATCGGCQFELTVDFWDDEYEENE